MIELPLITLDEAVFKTGIDPAELKDLGQRAGACYLLGRSFMFDQGHLEVIKAIKAGELDDPPPLEKEKKHRGADRVYFIQAGEFVKIGWSRNWKFRLKQLQRAHPESLTAIAIYRGSLDLEKKLHLQFTADRVRRGAEWFRLSEAIREYISTNKKVCLLR